MLNLSIVDWWVFPGKNPQILCVFRLEGIRGFVCIVYVRAKEGSSQLWEDRGWSDRYGRLPSPRKRMSRKKGRNNVRVFLFSCSTTHNNKKEEEERLLLFRCCYTRSSHRSSVVDWSPCCVDASTRKTFLSFFPRNSHKFFPFFWRHWQSIGREAESSGRY
jgi:hypothetical protein